MALRTSSPLFSAVCLAPGGNIGARYLSRARRLFAETGDASGLALPEVAVLTLGSGRLPKSAHPRLKEVLGQAWRELGRESFRPEGIRVSEGLAYLLLSEPFPRLAARLEGCLEPWLGAAPQTGKTRLPLNAAIGFFLGRARDGIEEGESYPEFEEGSGGFMAADLVLLELELCGEAWSATRWSEVLRVHRPGREGRARTEGRKTL